MEPLLLSIDQGTTSSRAMVFTLDGRPRSQAQREHRQYYPAPGAVEHDAEEIWRAVLDTARQAITAANGEIAAIGITNQRETCVLWERDTGAPIHPAIVWQDRRTADQCARLREAGMEAFIAERTGLLLDPYFSATKIAWLLDNVSGAREAAGRGRLLFGTIDTFLLWRLSGGRTHATDATNASRTLLYNIHSGDWDDDLLELFRIPPAILPEVRDSAADFGVTAPSLFGARLAIRGIAGDQQAATIGQACFAPGMVKSTYGTGSFLMLNTGAEAVASRNRLLTTIAYQLAGRRTYALEGSIFNAGSTVQWLRDGLKVIAHASETEALAAGLPDNRGVYLVPAFTGLGAPHWDPAARGLIAGLTRDAGPAELARASLESVGYQTRDLLQAMAADLAESGRGADTVLRADGGMIANQWLMQFLADMAGVPVDAPEVAETTALGAAYLAGLGAGLYDGLEDIAKRWRRARRFMPAMSAGLRDRLYDGWRRALQRTLM
ncbi:MAG: glycerol kinase [Proteobacteria bacterium]|nr:MAG: glycerol kinase [Pseudomonadota bacterium]